MLTLWRRKAERAAVSKHEFDGDKLQMPQLCFLGARRASDVGLYPQPCALAGCVKALARVVVCLRCKQRVLGYVCMCLLTCQSDSWNRHMRLIAQPTSPRLHSFGIPCNLST